MAFLLGEMAAARTGKIAIAKKNKIWVTAREFKQSFYVLGTPDEDEDDIVGAIGVPHVATLYAGAVCRGHEVKEIQPVTNPRTGDPGILYEVVGLFDNDIDPAEIQDQQDTDPTERRARVDWRGEFTEETLERDAIDGVPIATSAGERIVVTHPIPIIILEISRYESWPVDPLTVLEYSGRVNSEDFYGAPEGTAWLQPIEGPEEEVEGTLYVAAHYIVKFKIKEDPENPDEFLKDTWKMRLLDQGNLAFLPFSEPLTALQVLDDNGNPRTANLDGEGYKLPDGPDQEPVFREFNRFTKVDLNDLNLGPFA